MNRLIDNLEHSNIAELVVLVDVGGHPLQELQRPLELIILVKSSDGRILARKRILRRLGPGSTMQINDNIQARITSPLTQILQVLQPALREMLTVRVDQVLAHPVPDRDPDGIQPITYHLSDVILCDPGAPVARKSTVRVGLTQARDAVELGFLAAAAHIRPRLLCDPWLEDKLGAQIHAPDLAVRTREEVRPVC